MRISLRSVLLSAATAFVLSLCLYFYFGTSWGNTASFLFALLLLELHPKDVSRRETAASILLGILFAGTHVAGYSIKRTNSLDYVLRNAESLLYAACAFVSLLVLSACVFALLFRLLHKAVPACRGTYPTLQEKRRAFLLFLSVLLLGFLPWLVVFAPGLNLPDTVDQLLMANGIASIVGDGTVLTDHHPVFSTLLYNAFMQLGIFFGDANIGQLTYSILFLLADGICYALLFTELYECGLALRACLTLAVCTAVNPLLASYSFNMGKDLTVEPFVILFLFYMVRMLHTGGGSLLRRRDRIGLFLVCLFLMLLRKPSFSCLLFALPFLMIRFRRFLKPLLLTLVPCLLIFSLFYSRYLFLLAGIEPGETREML
ncbi:MAG: hypothetical protein IJS84_03490, partial [Spirochaetales bacterium]|nr:hypothetical protein [Spirochaetales bacterium]